MVEGLLFTMYSTEAFCYDSIVAHILSGLEDNKLFNFQIIFATLQSTWGRKMRGIWDMIGDCGYSLKPGVEGPACCGVSRNSCCCGRYTYGEQTAWALYHRDAVIQVPWHVPYPQWCFHLHVGQGQLQRWKPWGSHPQRKVSIPLPMAFSLPAKDP